MEICRVWSSSQLLARDGAVIKVKFHTHEYSVEGSNGSKGRKSWENLQYSLDKFSSEVVLVLSKQCFPDTIEQMDIWTHRDSVSMHKTCASSGWEKNLRMKGQSTHLRTTHLRSYWHLIASGTARVSFIYGCNPWLVS